MGVFRKSFSATSLYRRDIDLFEHLYEEYYRGAVFFANQYLNDLELSRDVAQDSFTMLWEKRNEINPNLNIQAFLLTIVKNKCLNVLRKRISERKHADFLLQRETMASYLALKDSSFDKYVEMEMEEYVSKILDEMPDKLSQVFRMNREEEFTYDEIAEKLGVSVKTVEYRMSKALFFFRNKLKGYILLLLMVIFRC